MLNTLPTALVTEPFSMMFPSVFLKGEHIGLVGANGEGKSTFFNIVTDKLMPDEGQDPVGKKCPRRLSGPAFCPRSWHDHPRRAEICFFLAFELEERMNTICDSLGEASRKKWKFLWRNWELSRIP